MTEYLPIFVFAFAALFAVAIVSQVQAAQKECLPPKEPLKYSMNLKTTKTALEQILTDPIMCRGVERFWLPPDITESPDGVMSLKYKIYYEFTVAGSGDGVYEQRLAELTLVAKLEASDNQTTLADFSFEEEKFLFGQAPESDYLKSETMARIIQRLAEVSIQQQVSST